MEFYRKNIIRMINGINNQGTLEYLNRFIELFLQHRGECGMNYEDLVISLIRQFHNKELLKRIYNLTEYLYIYKNTKD